jgi:hypothetical protein
LGDVLIGLLGTIRYINKRVDMIETQSERELMEEEEGTGRRMRKRLYK